MPSRQSSPWRRLCALLIAGDRRSSSADPKFYTTIRSRGSPKPRTRRVSRGATSISFFDLPPNLFGGPGDPQQTCGRRTSTPSTRCPTRTGSPTGSSPGRCSPDEAARGPLTGTGPAPGPMDGHRASEPAFARVHDARLGGETWFVSFDARGLSGGGDRGDPRRQQDLLDARLLAGRELPDHDPAGETSSSPKPRRSVRLAACSAR